MSDDQDLRSNVTMVDTQTLVLDLLLVHLFVMIGGWCILGHVRNTTKS